MNKENKRLCPECKGIIKPGRTEMVFEVKDLKVTVMNVSANICSKCGESFISGRVAEEVTRIVNRVSEDVNSFIKTQPKARRGHKEIAIAV